MKIHPGACPDPVLIILFRSCHGISGGFSCARLQCNGIRSKILHLSVGGLFFQLYFLVIFIHNLQRFHRAGVGTLQLPFVNDTDLVSGDHAAFTFQSGLGDVKDIGVIFIGHGELASAEIFQYSMDFVHIYPRAVRLRFLYFCLPERAETVNNVSRSAAGEREGCRSTDAGNKQILHLMPPVSIVFLFSIIHRLCPVGNAFHFLVTIVQKIL